MPKPGGAAEPVFTRGTLTSMDDLKKALLIVGGIVGVLAFVAFVYVMLADVGPPKPVEVTVTLDNKCELASEAFMVKVMPNGPAAFFDGKTAKVMAMSNQRIKLVANSRYQGFNFEGDEATAAPHITLVAICDSTARFDATSSQMKKQFGK
jgi:hypothetical protein